MPPPAAVEPRRSAATSTNAARFPQTTEDGEHQLYGFLTTTPNRTVRPVHEKAMPVILRTPEEIDVWMNAPAQVAFELQRPLPDDALKIVLRDSKEDAFAA